MDRRKELFFLSSLRIYVIPLMRELILRIILGFSSYLSNQHVGILKLSFNISDSHVQFTTFANMFFNKQCNSGGLPSVAN